MSSVVDVCVCCCCCCRSCCYLPLLLLSLSFLVSTVSPVCVSALAPVVYRKKIYFNSSSAIITGALLQKQIDPYELISICSEQILLVSFVLSITLVVLTSAVTVVCIGGPRDSCSCSNGYYHQKND